MNDSCTGKTSVVMWQLPSPVAIFSSFSTFESSSAIVYREQVKFIPISHSALSCAQIHEGHMPDRRWDSMMLPSLTQSSAGHFRHVTLVERQTFTFAKRKWQVISGCLDEQLQDERESAQQIITATSASNRFLFHK